MDKLTGSTMTKRAMVIIGPTTTGKTDLALSLAQKFNGELIACDSRQVFKGLDIGTGKLPTKNVNLKMIKASQSIKKSVGFWEISGVKIWLYDLIEPTEKFSAYDWVNAAQMPIKDIISRGKLPIIVGGTGLYLKALLEGFDSVTPPEANLRSELDNLVIADLQNRVAALSPARWQQLNNSDRNNPRRLIRILENHMYGYININNNRKAYLNSDFNILKIGLMAPRSYLNTKINHRVLEWFEQGIVEEVKGLMTHGISIKRLVELGLEYGLIAQYIDGKISFKEELIKLIQIKVRQYAKRQMTWFKRDKEIIWFDVSEPELSHRVEDLVSSWYNNQSSNE